MKWLQRLLACLCSAFTVSALFPLAGCISNIGHCERQNAMVNECVGRTEKDCNGVPGCTPLPACVHHCFGLGQTDCATSSDCHWYAGGTACLPNSDGCGSLTLAACAATAACKVGTDCQGDVDCGSVSDEAQCGATPGCYYQQGVT